MTAYTVVADPSEVEDATEQTPDTKPVWPDPFAIRPMADLRAFLMNGLSGYPVEQTFSEAPSAEEMARLAGVMGLDAVQLASVLRMPVGSVTAWLDPASGLRPTPETVTCPPDWGWRNFLSLWDLAFWWEKEMQEAGE